MNTIRRIAKVTMNQTNMLIQKQKNLKKFLNKNLYFIFIPLIILFFIYITQNLIFDFRIKTKHFYALVITLKSIIIFFNFIIIITYSSFLYYEIHPNFKIIDNKKELRFPNTSTTFDKIKCKDFKDFFKDEDTFNKFVKVLKDEKIKKSLTATNAIILIYKLDKLDVLKKYKQKDICNYAGSFFDLRIDKGAFSNIYNSFVNESNNDIHKDVFESYSYFNEIITVEEEINKIS